MSENGLEGETIPKTGYDLRFDQRDIVQIELNPTVIDHINPPGGTESDPIQLRFKKPFPNDKTLLVLRRNNSPLSNVYLFPVDPINDAWKDLYPNTLFVEMDIDHEEAMRMMTEESYTMESMYDYLTDDVLRSIRMKNIKVMQLNEQPLPVADWKQDWLAAMESKEEKN